jgi:GTP pyrophosphokinase
MIRQYELVDMVRAYDPNVDEALLDRAYVFAMRAHGSQTRHSGDPYFSHPLEVAGILTELKLDSATIATGLLHDTVEDTAASLEEITKIFGEEVAGMVDGVTKLSLLELSSEETKQAENFRKFMIAMSRDIRVLLVKLADRLHNMRTLHHHPKEASRRRIAQETMDLYAPLAGRIGMQDVRDELEDLSFGHLFPEARESILSRLSFVTGESGQLIEETRKVIADALQRGGVDATVSGRQKRPYSTWRKLQTKEISFEQLSDIIGFRVILSDAEECYQALGVLHRKWKTVPGGFKDYISIPKANGYQSIHTTIIGPKQQRVELQIRTEEMHEIAEFGIAAHWLYKERQSDLALNDDVAKPKSNPYESLRRFVELLDESDNPEEFLEHTKLEMFLDQVFCFTPNGDLIGLPTGATPIDFAYAVHTDIGDTCVGAKVNGVPVSLFAELQNGDSVEILRSDAQSPDPQWAGIVVTGKARSAIRRFVRDAERSEFIRLGRNLAIQTFGREGQEFTEKGLEHAAKRLNLDDPEEILVQVGNGTLTGYDVLTAVFPGQSIKARRARKSFRLLNRNRQPSPTVPIHGLKPGLAVHLSKCCHPIPGDRIVGIREPGKGVNVHTIDCAKLADHADTQDDWIDLSWDKDASERMRTIGRIRAFLQHETGSLGVLCTRIGDFDGNITNIKIHERRSDVHEVVVDIEVEDLQHLTHIVAALRANPRVRSVRRVRGGLGDGIM